MPSRGSQDPRWQRWIPKTVTLASIKAGEGVTKDVSFSVPVPDSRLRVKISLLFVPEDPTLTSTADLWIFEADTEDGGMRGDEVPLTNVEGTSAAPTSIPADSSLNGYSREFITAADYLNGRLTVNDEVAGFWLLQTRYQPQNTPFSIDEWKIVIAQCNPSASMVRLNG